MEPIELLTWRRKGGYDQTTVAKHLGVSRQTYNRWERGHHKIPANVGVKLLSIGVHQPGSGVPPEWLTFATKDYWPHLKLYHEIMRGKWQKAGEHPEKLFPLPMQYLPASADVPFRVPMAAPDRKWPGTFLESPEYLAALQQFRANPPTRKGPRFTDNPASGFLPDD